jgi:hypothetical protein
LFLGINGVDGRLRVSGEQGDEPFDRVWVSQMGLVAT